MSEPSIDKGEPRAGCPFEGPCMNTCVLATNLRNVMREGEYIMQAEWDCLFAMGLKAIIAAARRYGAKVG